MLSGEMRFLRVRAYPKNFGAEAPERIWLKENLAREATSLVRLARAKNAAASAAIGLRQLPPGAKSGAKGIEPTIYVRQCSWGQMRYPTVLVMLDVLCGSMSYKIVPPERNFFKKNVAGRSQHHDKHYKQTADMSSTNGWLGNRWNKQTCPIGWHIVTNEHLWDMTFRGGP